VSIYKQFTLEVTYIPWLRFGSWPGGIGETWKGAVAGYYGGDTGNRTWLPKDWAFFAQNRKLPIWAPRIFDNPDGILEGLAAVKELQKLGVPPGVWTAVDMGYRVEPVYLAQFGHVMAENGYKVWPYGHYTTLPKNPVLDGYWLVDHAGIGPFLYETDRFMVRATEYAATIEYTASAVEAGTFFCTKWWR
jgi:hypothetical protein